MDIASGTFSELIQGRRSCADGAAARPAVDARAQSEAQSTALSPRYLEAERPFEIADKQ
jgi:hypothetical protein